MKKIVLAGGCFWGVEAYYQRLKGIINTEVGYAQGYDSNPIYSNVKKGITGHSEVCLIEYDESIITLDKIFEHFFMIINPFSINRQGEDIGSQYRTGIYYDNESDLPIIKKYIDLIEKSYQRKIAVEVEKLKEFYNAEDYHQDYLLKNPQGYCHINLSEIKNEDLKEQFKKKK